MPLSRIPLWKIMHLWFWSTCMQLMMASTQESQAQGSIFMSYERVSYIILTTVFVSVNPACVVRQTLLAVVGIISRTYLRREKRELHFLKKLYTPYDVIPIRKPWNNGVGVTFQQPVCHEEDDVLMVSEYTRAPSSSVNWPCHLSSSKTCQLFFLHFWPYMQCRTSRLLSGLCFPQKIPHDGQKWKYECVFPQTSSSRVISPHL